MCGSLNWEEFSRLSRDFLAFAPTSPTRAEIKYPKMLGCDIEDRNFPSLQNHQNNSEVSIQKNGDCFYWKNSLVISNIFFRASKTHSFIYHQYMQLIYDSLIRFQLIKHTHTYKGKKLVNIHNTCKFLSSLVKLIF